MTCAIVSCPHHSADQSLCALDTPPAGGAPPHPHNRSLVVASLELGRVLADRGKVTFRAQGTCMFPYIQLGDVLHIESRTIDQIAVGDIVVFRRGDCLLGHRTIAKGIDKGKPYIVTRPDQIRQGDDGFTYGDDVLGAVTAIERRGKRGMPLDPQTLRSITARRAAGSEWWNWDSRPRLIERIAALQRAAWYRRIAPAWLKIARPRLSYVVHVPLNASQSHDLYRELSPQAFDVAQASWQGKPVTCWLLALYLNDARQAAVSATIDWHPEGCPRGEGWQVHELQLRLRYRGAGLDDALIAQAEAILARSGMRLQRVNP